MLIGKKREHAFEKKIDNFTQATESCKFLRICTLQPVFYTSNLRSPPIYKFDTIKLKHVYSQAAVLWTTGYWELLRVVLYSHDMTSASINSNLNIAMNKRLQEKGRVIVFASFISSTCAQSTSELCHKNHKLK